MTDYVTSFMSIRIPPRTTGVCFEPDLRVLTLRVARTFLRVKGKCYRVIKSRRRVRCSFPCLLFSFSTIGRDRYSFCSKGSMLCPTRSSLDTRVLELISPGTVLTPSQDMTKFKFRLIFYYFVELYVLLSQ